MQQLAAAAAAAGIEQSDPAVDYHYIHSFLVLFSPPSIDQIVSNLIMSTYIEATYVAGRYRCHIGNR